MSQQPLPLDLPDVKPVTDDYETWITAVWPAYERAAASGREFTIFQIAKEQELPEPPDPAHHWGRLATLLQTAGVIRHAGWANSTRPTVNASAVRTWIGVTTRLGAA